MAPVLQSFSIAVMAFRCRKIDVCVCRAAESTAAAEERRKAIAALESEMGDEDILGPLFQEEGVSVVNTVQPLYVVHRTSDATSFSRTLSPQQLLQCSFHIHHCRAASGTCCSSSITSVLCATSY